MIHGGWDEAVLWVVVSYSEAEGGKIHKTKDGEQN